MTPVNRFVRMLLCALAGCASGVLAQGTLEVIPLRHRTVEQVLPVLRPLLEPGGSLTGQRNRLIVRTGRRNLAELRAALDAIDTPLRRLAIAVRFESAAEASRRSLDASGAIGRAPSDPSADRARVEVQVTDSRAALDERAEQRLVLLEGARGFIATGESRPLREQQVIPLLGGAAITERIPLLGGAAIIESTVIREAMTGVEVVPRLSGDIVFLEIAPRREAFAPGASGAVRGEYATSSVSGRLGEWIELGGTGGSSTRGERGVLSTNELRASEHRRIWVKVEEVKP